MIVQTVVSHTLYLINKKQPESVSYNELAIEWEKLLNKNDVVEKVDIIQQTMDNFSNTKNCILSLVFLPARAVIVLIFFLFAIKDR